MTEACIKQEGGQWNHVTECHYNQVIINLLNNCNITLWYNLNITDSFEILLFSLFTILEKKHRINCKLKCKISFVKRVCNKDIKTYKLNKYKISIYKQNVIRHTLHVTEKDFHVQKYNKNHHIEYVFCC